MNSFVFLILSSHYILDGIQKDDGERGRLGRLV